jgi:hypothetical protein
MGWNGEKDESGRSGLIMIGDGARKYFDPTIWIKKTISQLEAIDATYKHQKGLSWVAEPMVFITDCRYPNEIEMPKKWALQNGHSIYAVRIVRDNHESKLTPEQLANISEIALDDFVGWDYVILNNGSFQEFNESVETVINDVVIHY